MEVWKIIFRSKWVISRFQPLIFQGVVPGIYLDSPWPVRVPKKSPCGLIRTFYSPPFSAGPNICICTCICTCTCTCTCICTCTCTCMCMCMCMCMYTYIYIYPLSFHHCLIPPINAGRKQKQHKQRLHEGWRKIAPPPAIFLQPGLPGRPGPCLDFLDWRKKHKLWDQWHGIYHINDMVCFFHTLTYFINIWHMYFFFIVARDLPYHLIIKWCRIFLRY